MRGFLTLLWLEYRRSRVWAAALLGSLLFWFWGLNQVTVSDIGERAGIRVAILGVATLVGLVVLCFMIGRLRSEGRRGQYEVLLLTPPSGYLHILARFLFALGVGIVYAVILGGLVWWIAAKAGTHPDTGSILQLFLAGPFYTMGAILVPFLSWTLLLMVFISAYRLSGPNWIPGIVMVAGTPFVFNWIGDWIVALSYRLPAWPMFGGFTWLIDEAEIETDVFITTQGVLVPQEPLWIMLALSIVMLAIAGRIWQEVEG
jgi:MFS family permease